MKRIELLQKIETLPKFGYSERFAALVYIHYLSGCRVSDLLKIRGKDFTESYYVSIKQGKNSDPLILFIDKYHKIIDVWRSNNELISGTYTASSLYKIYKKIGLSLNRGEKRKKAVTHIFRVALARDIVDSGLDKDFASKALGHKSKKSVEFYLRDNKRSATIQRGVINQASGSLGNIIVQKNGVIRIKSK